MMRSKTKWDEAIEGTCGRGCPKCLVGRHDMMSDPMFHCDVCSGTGIPHFMLFSAAEALLSALRALAVDYDSMLGDGVTEDTQPAVLTIALAAIAKAEQR